jgi:hypothetical protein
MNYVTDDNCIKLVSPVDPAHDIDEVYTKKNVKHKNLKYNSKSPTERHIPDEIESDKYFKK